MGYFAKKILGGFKALDGDHTNRNAEYYIQTVTEYEETQALIEELKQAVQKAEDKTTKIEILARKKLNDAQNNFELQLQNTTKKSEDTIAELQSILAFYKERISSLMVSAAQNSIESDKKLEEKQQELSVMTELNNNLKRIALERANARRGLYPKKQRTGYIVLYSSQYQEQYTDEYGKSRTAQTWKSVLQTPYDASLPLHLIEKDLYLKLKYHILNNLGIEEFQAESDNGKYKSWKKSDKHGTVQELCGLYRWFYTANYKSGYWEMTFYHTKRITVPAEFRNM